MIDASKTPYRKNFPSHSANIDLSRVCNKCERINQFSKSGPSCKGCRPGKIIEMVKCRSCRSVHGEGRRHVC